MTTEIHQTNVNMEGLLEVLGKNLYSTPHVAIRELIQNAHDACIRRKLEANHASTMHIRIRVNEKKHQLIIEDDGSGLTYDEIHQFLATIGSGYTRELRHATDTEEMIGYFGLGFLSAYVIADKVDVWTTSWQAPEQSWNFSSRGGKQFSVRQADKRSVGSTVTLAISEHYRELLSVNILRSLLAKYCCMLPIPIFINDDDKPVNDLTVPWRHATEQSPVRIKKERLAFAELFEEHFKPVCVIPVPYNESLNIHGLIWIQDASGFSTSDYRNVSVFIRNMFITQEGRDLLPSWAGFVGCVINTTHLTPTASREDIQTDQQFSAIREYLTHSLVNGLKQIATQEPENWRRVLTRHNQALMGAAVVDDTLFDLLKDDLKVPTSQGDLTLKALLEKSNRTFYLRTEDKNSYEDVLFRARMMPVISGYLFAVASYCQKYADRHQLPLITLGTGSGNSVLFPPVTLPDEQAERLRQCFSSSGDSIHFTRVEPSHIPLIIIEDKDVALKKRIEQDDMDKRVGSAALALARLHTATINDEITQHVYINLNNPLIQRLFTDFKNDPLAHHLAQVLRSFMITICHDATNTNADITEQLAQFTASLNAMM